MNRKNKKARLEKLEKAYEKMPHGPLTLTFRKGLRDGIPICLGYLSVSFTFGMMVVENDLPAWIAMMISMTNLTSAGQFAGTELIIQGAMYVEVAITTFVINIRYMLMSLSLSQKVEERMTNWQRLVLSFGITDEVFAVAMQQKEAINSRYMSGLILTPYLGWSCTLLEPLPLDFCPFRCVPPWALRFTVCSWRSLCRLPVIPNQSYWSLEFPWPLVVALPGFRFSISFPADG